MTFNFVVDRIVQDTAYPTLAQHQAEPYTPAWREFRQHWPYTQPVELLEYCNEHSVTYALYTIEAYPIDSYYVIHLSWFDFAIDYIALLPKPVFDAVKNNKLRILFYYHEGDNPVRIKYRLDSLCAVWELNYTVYRFVSGNTRANLLENFVYFCDHELLYYNRNKNNEKILKTSGSLMRVFTALSRTHKWWRATSLADLHRRSLLDNSYWSYSTELHCDDRIEDCAIEIDTLNLREYLTDFIACAPYRADDLSSEQHNDHNLTVEEHYTNAYCNIVFETVFDADQSGGTFLTEKTFKPIKHGQPFVIAGCAGSLQVLRDLGYRVFDSVIDNSYDLITNNTERWIAIRNTIEQIKNSNLEEFRLLCQSDVEHNQQVFLSSKRDRLNRLLEKLNT